MVGLLLLHKNIIMKENTIIIIAALVLARLLYLKEVKEKTGDSIQRLMVEEQHDELTQKTAKPNAPTPDDLGYAMMQQWD